MNRKLFTALAVIGAGTLTSNLALADDARMVGSTVTAKKLMGADHRLNTYAFDDPEIRGATCYLTRAVAGGWEAAVGLSTDTSDASVACRQTGPMYSEDAKKASKNKGGEVVFSAKLSPLFKGMDVIRYFDDEKKTYIYVTKSHKFIDGSPKNSTSAITPQQWKPLAW